ncbi:formate dehydrogenase accessory sulfurtransferase FdhD [Vibrio sp. PP-XX7]
MPVALEYNGVAYTVMMCTPINLEEFAVGFSLTEGIIEHDRDIHHIEVQAANNGITLSIEVANRCINRLKEKRRSLMGVTGCGICGAEQLSSVCRCITPLPTNSTFACSHLDDVLSQLMDLQPLNQATGASHAAAYVGRTGKIEAVYEDVGRHIALDKLVGWIAQTHQSQGAILVTSRASFEMVQKVAVSGIEILFAISAATSMAVDLAERLNITLCGYCRQGRANIYTHAERMIDLK